jgi:class 3 adenylate cyclase
VVTCPSCHEDSPVGFRFCGSCGAPVDAKGTASISVPTVPATDERKVVSILFCDLVGFTAASEHVDPEDVAARLRPYHALLRRTLEAFGGTVEKFVGDAVMAVWGAPTAHEDDAERAIRAGLAILDEIERLNASTPSRSLAVRIGINTGEALVDLNARPDRGEVFVTGDVVNTAARIQAAATSIPNVAGSTGLRNR